MYADSVQVLDIGKGSTGISISGDGTHTRVNPLGITDSNVTTRLQVKASHLASGGSEVNIIDVVGTNQGDALIHFGQSHNAGGFIYYRGDGTSDSAFDNLPGSDTIFFGSNNHSTVGNQPVMSYKYNGQDVNFHGDVGIGLSADGTHTNPQAKLEVINSGGDTIARFKGTDDNAYVRILQTVDVTGAAGIISENTEGNKIFMGYHDSQLKLVYATGPGSTNGIIINSDGRVGIDTSAGTLHDAFGGVTMELDVHHGDIGCKQLFFEPDENSVGQSFRILIGTFGASTAVRLGFQGSSNGTAAGSAKYITHNASGAAFTGQHPCKPFRSITNYVDKIGHIVVSKGTIANYPENWWNDESNSYDSSYLDKVTINESLPVIELSNQPNDKKVYGVIANVDDPNTTDRDDTNQTGGFSNYIENRIDDRIAVNSVGEGAIMVCNINGNLENGDYITTSAIEGLGMKQDDDLLHNYTVAKIVQDCNFDSGTTDVTYNGVTYKAKLVGCTYHCG